MSSADISPSGRPLEQWSSNYRGQVILGPDRGPLPDWTQFGPQADELDGGAMTAAEIQADYTERTGLTGRYRVLEQIAGTGVEAIRAKLQEINYPAD